MHKRRFTVKLLSTADGIHLGNKRHQKEDTVVILLWCANKEEAEKTARKIADALSFSTHIGEIEYQLLSLKRRRK